MIQKISIEKIKKISKALDIVANDENLLIKALTHRSFLNESLNDEHNERLEFLGDAVLELIITEFLYRQYPDRTEGELTSFRAALVKTESLAETAVDLSLGEYILMSKGEESTGGRERPYILANTYEAVLGFLYLDQGLEKSREFVARTLIPKIDNIVEHRLDIDNKSKLQELSQEILKLTPSYDLISEEGPDHEKKFTLAVMIGETKFGTGEGFSKQEAAQNAAGDALENWEESVRNYENKNK